VSIAVFGELSQYVMLNYFFLSPQFVLQASFLEFMPVRLTDVTVDLNSNEQWETRTVPTDIFAQENLKRILIKMKQKNSEGLK
jgi:hypothetical protein